MFFSGENLWNETINILEQFSKTFDDVYWIGGDDFTISKEQFKELANTHYYAGFGSPKVATDLKVVGKDWWLERHEYDGSEWWEFKVLPIKPKEKKKVNRVLGGMWDTLKELNEEDE